MIDGVYNMSTLEREILKSSKSTQRSV